jgi:glycosyltransferase involved in cell wall biosynthesis
MKQATLSLCMIARNESEHIGRCLRSVRDHVDEIILVDTGSTDDTIDIARAWGARVIEERWRDDFSHARNISLEHATGDWILYLDCDEELAPESGPELRALLQGSRYEAYFIQVSNITREGTKFLALGVRLFRNRKIYRFQGKIHEQIVESIIDNYGRQSIGHCKLSIIHHGYDPRQANIQAKSRRNLKLLASVPDAEKNGFYYYNLGTEYLRLGENEQGLACYLKAAGMTKPSQGYGPILAVRTITTLIKLHRYADALGWLRHFQAVYKDFNDLVYLEAFCHYRCGRYSLAVRRLQRYLGLPPAPDWYVTETSFSKNATIDFRDWLEERAIPGGHPGISACVIGRDEADHIPGCIRSLGEIAREVIYVDTGSTDNSPEIARQYGAKVFAIPWTGDFSKARHYALSKASSKWVLVLDADELLPDGSGRQIAELLGSAGAERARSEKAGSKKTGSGKARSGKARTGRAGTGKAGPEDVAGYILKVCTFIDPGSAQHPSANCVLTGSCRLFRKSGARYRGAAGEDVAASLIRPGRTVVPAEITINHLHYCSEPESIARKRQWKIDAVNRGLQDDPVRQNYLLGVELFYADDFTGAASCFEACLERGGMPGALFYYHALSLINTGEHRRAAGVLEEAEQLFPDYTDLKYLRATALSLLGDMEAVAALLRRCLAMGDAPWQKYLVSPGAGSFKAMCSLGRILVSRGDISESLDLLLEAAKFPGVLEQAVEGIAILHDRLPAPLEQLLQSRGILNPESLCAASRAFARMQRWQDSLYYLSLAGVQLDAGVAGAQPDREPAPWSCTNLTRAIDLLILAFCSTALKPLPDPSPLRQLFAGRQQQRDPEEARAPDRE